MLISLGSLCKEFQAALALFNFAQEADSCAAIPGMPTGMYFLILTAHAAASVIYRFNETLGAASINLNKSPSVLNKIDMQAKRDATRLFKKHFPDFAGARHSGQHEAKLFGTHDNAMKHADQKGVIAYNNIAGNQLVTAYERKQIILEISEESLRKLCEVRDAYWAVFAPLDPYYAPRDQGPEQNRP